jgi:hypothetical protein
MPWNAANKKIFYKDLTVRRRLRRRRRRSWLHPTHIQWNDITKNFIKNIWQNFIKGSRSYKNKKIIICKTFRSLRMRMPKTHPTEFIFKRFIKNIRWEPLIECYNSSNIKLYEYPIIEYNSNRYFFVRWYPMQWHEMQSIKNILQRPNSKMPASPAAEAKPTL